MNRGGLLALATCAVASVAQAQRPLHVVAPDELPATPVGAIKFTPPALDTIPNTPLGDMIRFGRDVFVDTQRYAKKYVGNALNCVNCHLDDGRQANSAPLWAAYVAYPSFRSKNDQVNTFEQRLEGCFRFSMNGSMPPPDSAIVVGLVSYSYWLATGAPVGAQLAGRGFPVIPPPPLAASAVRGEAVYAKHCAECHQPNGRGMKGTFPPVWGPNSYNKGAGMYRVHTAAAFIKANMPLGQVGTLSDQEAWDVAAFINSHSRPPAPPGAPRKPQSQ